MQQHRKSFSLALLAVSFLLTGGLSAQSPTKYIWHDGNVTRQIYVVPELLAEFGSGQAGVRSAFANAAPVGENGGARLFRVAGNRSVVRGNGGSGGGYSPVFSDNAGSGTKRALPGNILVQLDGSWSDAHCTAWAVGQGLRILQRLPINGNFFEISSPAGLASLELANRLHGTPGVVFAQPNWWAERFAR